MNNRVTRFAMILVAGAIYLNVGWAIGTYYHNYIFGHEPQTFWQQVWSAKGVVSNLPGNNTPVPLYHDQILFALFWPFQFCILLIMWCFHAMEWCFWLFFGGIAKLLGVG